jgi:hypothetical protein
VVTLKVNFKGDRLVFDGTSIDPATDKVKRYEYVPARDKGTIEVLDGDVNGLLIKIVREGCGCKNKDGGDVQIRQYPMFER